MQSGGTADGPDGAGRQGAPMFTPAPRPAGPPNRVPPMVKKRGDGLERRPPVGTARRRRAESRIATSRHDSHSARPQRVQWSRPQGNAGQSSRWGFTPAPPPAGPRNRVPPMVKKRGDGLERRPPAGTARRRRAESRIATSRHDSHSARPQRVQWSRPQGNAGQSSRWRLHAGTAARRAAKPRTADGEEARGRLGTPASGRHSPP